MGPPWALAVFPQYQTILRIFDVLEFDQAFFLDQCDELKQRYSKERRPLGPKLKLQDATNKSVPKKNKASSNNKKKNRKKKGRASTSSSEQPTKRTHSQEIQEHLDRLLTGLVNMMLPRAATAAVLTAVASMLCEAVNADPEIRDLCWPSQPLFNCITRHFCRPRMPI